MASADARAATPGRANLDITLVEAGNKLGRGLAYATERDFCLLNSPAGSMSIMPDDPLHFVRWLQANGMDATPHTFARRHDFGTYIEVSLIRAIADRWRARSRLRLRIGTGAWTCCRNRPVSPWFSTTASASPATR